MTDPTVLHRASNAVSDISPTDFSAEEAQRLAEALRRIWQLTRNTNRLPKHGKAIIANIARSALKAEGRLYD